MSSIPLFNPCCSLPLFFQPFCASFQRMSVHVWGTTPFSSHVRACVCACACVERFLAHPSSTPQTWLCVFSQTLLCVFSQTHDKLQYYVSYSICSGGTMLLLYYFMYYFFIPFNIPFCLNPPPGEKVERQQRDNRRSNKQRAKQASRQANKQSEV